MNKNGKNGNEAALVASEHDDLQKISGIGPKFAKALYQSGINSYTDLVQHTPEQLASLLTQQGNVKIAPERIEADHWLEQAQVFVAESDDLDSDLDIEEVDTRPLSETAAEELAIGPKPQEWHQHAGFSLFFDYIAHNADEREWQTRLYHEETGNEALVEGTDTAVWAEWIEKQANLPYPTVEEESEKVETAVAPHTTQTADVELQIVEVTVSASTETEESCDVDVQFTLSGADAMALISQSVPYQIELQTIDLAAKTINHRIESDMQHLQPDMSEYTVRERLPLPAPGQYELQTVLYLHAPGEKIAYHIGPTLNID
jgi:hypothetical protein